MLISVFHLGTVLIPVFLSNVDICFPSWYSADICFPSWHSADTCFPSWYSVDICFPSWYNVRRQNTLFYASQKEVYKQKGNGRNAKTFTIHHLSLLER